MNNKFSGFCFALTLAAVSSSSIAAITPTSIGREISYIYNHGDRTEMGFDIGPSTFGEWISCCGYTNQYSSISASEVIFDGSANIGHSYLYMQFQVTETKDYGLDWNIHHYNAPNPNQFVGCGSYSVVVTRNGSDASRVSSSNCSTTESGVETLTGQALLHFGAGDTGTLLLEVDSDYYYYFSHVNAHFAEVTSVPVPASLPLLSSALASLVFGSRLRSRNKR